jgi:hypothetical protein
MSPDEEIYPHHLQYYDKVPSYLFWRERELYPEATASFKVDYDIKGKELYYIESTLYTEIVKKRKAE